jgi:hypothetical protein
MTEQPTDPIRARLDAPVTQETLWTEAVARDRALRAVLDLADSHYDAATGYNIRRAIAQSLGVDA